MSKTTIQFDGSSCLAEATYDGNHRELDLVFRSNGRRHYVLGGVEGMDVARLTGADSPGKVYHDFFAGVYPVVRKYEEVS